jgi:tRNA pseudouridine55 synthase
VTIRELRLVEVNGPLVFFEALVSSGTYIRSLAHDLGERLGVKAHLAELRRTAVGEFDESTAVPLEKLKGPGEVHSSLVPAEELLPSFPKLSLSGSEVESLLHGKDLRLALEAEWVRVLNSSGKLCAIVRRTPEGFYHPTVVLPL